MKWIEIKEGDNSTLPKEGEEYLFDGSETEQAPVYARVKYNGKHPCLVVLDSSGEEEYYPISDYYRWLDQSDGWISCEDRLPENDDGIMLFTEEEGVFQGWAEEDEDTGKRNNFYFGGYQRAYGVTHWQPLPAAPLVNNLNK